MDILNSVNGHKDLLALSDQDQTRLCAQIREFLIENVSVTGGHLASNLGVVELTVALETVFDTETDRLVFDVGHQCYVHKLLTGRKDRFSTLRRFGGISGFPKPEESISDAFVAGHASNSVSIALGMARARTLTGKDHHVIALLGDGAATGGMVYEAMNDAADSGEPMIIILNDNEMSIEKNVGGLARHLSKLRTKERYLGMKTRYRNALRHLPGGLGVYRFTSKVKDRVKRLFLPSNIFDNIGLDYLGPVDGHDLPELLRILRIAKCMKSPVLVHVMTQKGRGYLPAENSPSQFHGVGQFDIVSGEFQKSGEETFSQAFGGELLELAMKNDTVCAITAAMPTGTCLTQFCQQLPDRFFDVGIAEEHAISMAGGLAKEGMLPIVALYSTFFQRGYDQLMQDVAMLNLPVIFCIDRSGLVGDDGATHHGIYDLGILKQVPNMRVLCPGSCLELRDMLSWAVSHPEGPVAIRYPRGGDRGYSASAWTGRESGLIKIHRSGERVVLVTYSTMLDNVMKAAEILSSYGIETTVIRLLQVQPLPVYALLESIGDTDKVFVIEEAAEGSCIFQELAYAVHEKKPCCMVKGISFDKAFLTHGKIADLYAHYGMDPSSLAEKIREDLEIEN